MALILNDMMIRVVEHRAGHAALAEAHDRLGALLDKQP